MPCPPTRRSAFISTRDDTALQLPDTVRSTINLPNALTLIRILLVPVLVGAARRREVRLALASVPAFFVLRTVNAIFFLRAVCAELLLGRSLRVYEKGH